MVKKPRLDGLKKTSHVYDPLMRLEEFFIVRQSARLTPSAFGISLTVVRLRMRSHGQPTYLI